MERLLSGVSALRARSTWYRHGRLQPLSRWVTMKVCPARLVARRLAGLHLGLHSTRQTGYGMLSTSRLAPDSGLLGELGFRVPSILFPICARVSFSSPSSQRPSFVSSEGQGPRYGAEQPPSQVQPTKEGDHTQPTAETSNASLCTFRV